MNGGKTEHEEISEVASELWRTRRTENGTPEDDWYRAEQIVRGRRKRYSANNASGGNNPLLNESHKADVSFAYTHNQTDGKEHSEIMDNTTQQGTAESYGSEQSGSGSGIRAVAQRAEGAISQATNRAKDVAGDVMHRAQDAVSRAGNMMEREPHSMPRAEHREGPVARGIEQQTAKIPSDAFLWAAVGSIGLSLALELSGREKTATFVGHWAPTLLILGLYNKMVKLHGSDGI